MTEQTFKVASQHEADSILGQSEEVNQSVTRGTKTVTKIIDDSGKQTMQIIEDVVIVGPQKGQVVTKKKHFWSDWGVIGGTSSEVPKTKQPENGSADNSDWKVIGSGSQSTLSKQPEIDFEDNKHSDLLEVKVEGSSSTGKYHTHYVLK